VVSSEQYAEQKEMDSLLCVKGYVRYLILL